MKNKSKVHPYIPNSVPRIKEQMLREIGVKSIEELYEDIPDRLRLKRDLKLPRPFLSEADLMRHVQGILAKNRSCGNAVSFLGGGCSRHYVPAICDEINHRSEFLTAYAGEPYEDHGRFQALFEYESMMGELLDYDVVNVPTYDWTQAASTSILMSGRITGRDEICIAGTVSPDRFSAISNYIRPTMKIVRVGWHQSTGLMDLEELREKTGPATAGIYFEYPSYLGCIEEQAGDIADTAHQNGSLCIAGVDPLSLGILVPPGRFGADIACGDIQSLGLHMSFGGALGGFIASRDEEKYVMEFPSRLFGITRTEKEGEWGFDDVAYERTSFAERELGKEFVGTGAALWGITAGVYLSLMGPAGMKDLGKHMVQKTQYTMKRLEKVPGVSIRFTSSPFKEFVVDFSGTGKSVKEINACLLDNGIFGGKDLTPKFPELQQCALYCVTELITKEDIDKLITVLGLLTG